MDMEQKIAEKASKEPRVTPQDIEAEIASEWYFTAADGCAGVMLTGAISPQDQPPVPKEHPLRLLTFCVLVLRNGYTVTGESACVSPENFSAEIGRKLARDRAASKLYPILGYALKSKLQDSAQGV